MIREMHNIRQPIRLAGISFSLFSGWLLTILFEGQILSRLLEAQTIAPLPLTGMIMLVHFLGLLLCGWWIDSFNQAKHAMMISAGVCLLGSFVLFLPYSILWSIALLVMAFFAGIYVASFAYDLKVYAKGKLRYLMVAFVLVLSNAYMLIIDVVGMVISTQAALIMVLLGLSVCIGLIKQLKQPEDEMPRQVSGVRKPMTTLGLFVLLLTIASGLMYSVVLPSFSQFEQLVTYYWVVPYLLMIVILSFFIEHIYKAFILHVGLAMAGLAFLVYIVSSQSMMTFLVVNTLMMGAFGLLDLFWWCALASFLDDAHRPVLVFGTGLALNVLGIRIGSALGLQFYEQWDDRVMISVMAMVVLLLCIVLLPFLYHQLKGEMTLKVSAKTKMASWMTVLTERETEIAQLILKGYTFKAIAEVLGVSPNTIKYHTKNLYSKFEVNSKMDLIQILSKNDQSHP